MATNKQKKKPPKTEDIRYRLDGVAVDINQASKRIHHHKYKEALANIGTALDQIGEAVSDIHELTGHKMPPPQKRRRGKRR